MTSFGIYGIIQLILAFIFLLIQAVTLPHFMIHKEYRKVVSYQLMFIIGVFESYLIIGTGVLPFFKNIGLLGQFSEKLTGAIYEAAFDVLFILNLALALNRLFVMVKLYILKHVNVAESKCELLMYKCLFVLFAIIFAAIAALFMSPYCGLYMDEQFNCFRYDKNLSFSMHVYHFEVYEYLILTIACFLIYCGIAFLIKINAPKISNYGNNATNQNRKSMEMRILVQSFVQYCLFLVPLIVGTLGAPPSWSLIDYFGIITIFEILFFGLNPIIYFISLASFRNKVINGLCFWIKPKTASYALPKSIQVKPSNINGGLSIQL